ncbi:MAG: aspartate kinase [Bacteroidia bacterium]|jgi:aspartate kinase|nr:aspartate kinase [Bacteroidia bacterium]
MKVFKFGGASVKDAAAVKNVAGILSTYSGEPLVVVVSAMGKTTNALERLADSYFKGDTETAQKVLDEVREYHTGILNGLFEDKAHGVFNDIHNTLVELEWVIEDQPTHEFDCEYDQIVSVGELLSTKIVSHYLTHSGIVNRWQDVRDWIKTDNTYREAKVDWTLTQQCIRETLVPYMSGSNPAPVITQGFLGVTSENFTTTLGREGSDYTAAIIAYCMDAESVTIWKDVPGVLNADPKWFDNTELIPQLSYQDAIELTYYGATVIHPKTIKPLQNKNIPLQVRSFVKPEAAGTVIHGGQVPLPVPCFIFKMDQVLLSIAPKDFSFIVEENLSRIFGLFSEHGIHLNMMQNSALRFSVVIDNNARRISGLIEILRRDFQVLKNENLELVTIRHYNQATLDRVTVGKDLLLEVKSRYTAQIVMKNSNL